MVAKTERPVIGGQVHHSGEMMITGEIGMSHLAITVEVVALIATNDEITMIEMIDAITEAMALIAVVVTVASIVVEIDMEVATISIAITAAVEVASIAMNAETEEMAMVQGMVATNDD